MRPRRYLFPSLAGLALASAMAGAQLVLPDNRPRLPKPPVVYSMTPRQHRKREERREANAHGRKANRSRLQQMLWRRSPEETRFRSAVAKMTNWERNHWARAGYPGQHDFDHAALSPFIGCRQARREALGL